MGWHSNRFGLFLRGKKETYSVGAVQRCRRAIGGGGLRFKQALPLR